LPGRCHDLLRRSRGIATTNCAAFGLLEEPIGVPPFIATEETRSVQDVSICLVIQGLGAEVLEDRHINAPSSCQYPEALGLPEIKLHT